VDDLDQPLGCRRRVSAEDGRDGRDDDLRPGEAKRADEVVEL
jgi:hypothetical protein